MTAVVGDSGARWTLTEPPVAVGPHAIVYRATGEDGLPAAVKLARMPGRSGAWLEDEADALRVWGEHPDAGRGVLPWLDQGRWDGRWFSVTAWMPTSLRDAARGADPARRRALAVALIDAVVAARRHGLAHPNLHLGNVRVEGSSLFLADLGERPAVVAAYSSRSILPSTSVTAPEVIREGLPGDDLFSLAACVFELLTGEPPDAPLRNLLGHGPELALTAADRRRVGAVAGPAVAAALAGLLAPLPQARVRAPTALRAALTTTASPSRAGPWVATAAAVAAAVLAVIASRSAGLPRQAPPPYALAAVPGGRFQMGSAADDPQHGPDERATEVEVSPFRLGVTEVTQAQWRAVLGGNPTLGTRRWEGTVWGPCSPYDGRDLVGADLPVVCASWWDAIALANAWSEAAGLQAVYTRSGDTVRWDRDAPGYRLPTEAEWEFAARAGDPGPFGGMSALCRVANLRHEGCDDGFAGLAPVGRFGRNRYGLADLLGNAQEWVWDRYGPYPAGPSRDPDGAASGGMRVNRGGSWYRSARTVAWRSADAPEVRAPSVGVRLARNAPR